MKRTGPAEGPINDTSARYDEKAAAHAWGRTLALFNRMLLA